MIDPRIALGVQVPNVSNMFENFLTNVQNREVQDQKMKESAAMLPISLKQGQQAVDMNEQTLTSNRDAQRLQNLYQTGQRLKPFLANNDIQGATKFMLDNISGLQSRIEAGENLDLTESMQTLQNLQQGNAQQVISDINAIENIATKGSANKQYSAKSFAPIMNEDTGQMSTPVFDPNTQSMSLVPIDGAFGETKSDASEREYKAAQQEAALDIKTTEAKERVKSRVARASQITSEIGDRNRSAARSQRPLKQALKLASKATQGFSGAAKLQLSKLLPGIDATNEAMLDATLKQLALEQLQQFKGPTTDFEFGVTQSIAGDLGNSAEANAARIKSLDRNNWFNQREFNQFQKHIGNGGDPDAFSFNFGEPVKTKKGVFTLQDIQDTAVENNLTIEETLKRLNN